MMFFLTIILPILYVILIAAFFYAIFNISNNSNKHTQLLHLILEEFRANKNSDSDKDI